MGYTGSKCRFLPIDDARSQLTSQKEKWLPTILSGLVIGVCWYFIFQENAMTYWHSIFNWSGPGIALLAGQVLSLLKRYIYNAAIRDDLKLVDAIEAEIAAQ